MVGRNINDRNRNGLFSTHRNLRPRQDAVRTWVSRCAASAPRHPVNRRPGASTFGRILQHYRPMTSDIKRQSVNQLLNSLEPGAFERVAKKLTRVKLRPKEVVYKPNEPIDHVIFPENAVVCLMTIMSNGDTIEAATVGREGASWISASVGAPSMPCETIVVIEGTALRLPIADLERELKGDGHFRHVLTEYSHALLIASMRTAACHGLHGLQERCARWILMTLDRVDADRFAVTKEFLAQLLGTNRPWLRRSNQRPRRRSFG